MILYTKKWSAYGWGMVTSPRSQLLDKIGMKFNGYLHDVSGSSYPMRSMELLYDQT